MNSTGCSSALGDVQAGCRSARRFRLPLRVCLVLAVLLPASGCIRNWNARFARSDEAARLTEQARTAQDRGDPATAERLLREALKTNPSSCETRLELSELLVQHGSMDSAAEHLRTLIEQNPDDPRGYVRLAQVLYQKRELDEASQLLDAALDMDPANTQGLLLRGRIEEFRQRDDRALEAYHRVLLSDARQVEAGIRIAALHLEQGRPHQAAPLLRSVLENTAACPAERSESQWLLGTAYAQEGRWPDAVAALKAGSTGRTMTAADWYQVAYACAQTADMSGAQRATQAALRISPQHAQSLAMQQYLQAHDNAALAVAQDPAAGPPAIQQTANAAGDVAPPQR